MWSAKYLTVLLVLLKFTLSARKSNQRCQIRG